MLKVKAIKRCVFGCWENVEEKGKITGQVQGGEGVRRLNPRLVGRAKTWSSGFPKGCSNMVENFLLSLWLKACAVEDTTVFHHFSFSFAFSFFGFWVNWVEIRSSKV